MCHVCRRKFPKRELERYVCRRDDKGGKEEFWKDPEQTLPGRGFYLCAREQCRNAKRAFRGRQKKCRGKI
ncbi:MAG: DUF448 domain-containing protein [Desulfohalobiaceae bacterium]|nr:DUF448 domain-containing protein [Desulfohalobiaceae bacterium]